jgi:hypothetical protein
MPTQQMLLGGGGGGDQIGDQSNPAVNGKVINTAGRATGWYWIKTSGMASAKPVYINNTDVNGGWMLATYKYQVSGNPVSFPNFFSESAIPSSWTNLSLSTDVFDLWYHNSTYQVQEMLTMWATTNNQQPILSNFTTADRVDWGTSASNFINPNVTGTHPNQNATISTTGNMLSGTTYNVQNLTNLYGTGSGGLSVTAPDDWLYNSGTGFYWAPKGPSTDTTLRSGNGQGTGQWINAGSADFYGGMNVAPGASSQNLSCQSFALYIR